MENTFEITIKDIMQREIFQHAKVIAGKKGLKNEVRWTHILETNKFDTLLNGNELILTTGAGLKLDISEGTNFINNLIAKKTAGICIELGTHVDTISEEVINIANKFDFPIIVFDHVVKFIDITQDLHGLIIHNHHHLLKLLNELSRSFNELSLLPNGILKILEKLYKYTNGIALYIKNDEKSSYYPPESKEIEKEMKKYIIDNSTLKNRQFISLNNKDFIIVPVKGSGITWGFLSLEVKKNTMLEMLFPVLEQAALAIAQIMLRNRIIEERSQNVEDRLVRNLLYGQNFNLNELQQSFPILEQSFSFGLVLIQMNKQKSKIKNVQKNEGHLQKSILIRSIFTQHGFSPAISINNNEIAIIAFFKKNKERKTELEKISKVIKMINQTQEKHVFDIENYQIGVSSFQSNLSAMSKCYEEAKKVIFLKSSNIISSTYYERIGVYRLLLNQTKKDLELYVQEYLKPLIVYDIEKNSSLLHTLEVYLECRNGIKEASDRLFIVRQTLYHRLKKIEELLGDNYLEPDNRIAIEIAIKANNILSFYKEN